MSVIANPAFGFPSDLGQRVFHLLVARWDAQRLPDEPRVYISRREICQGLGFPPSGRMYQLIELQLRAMKAMVIECSDAWYERSGPGRPGAYAPGRKTVSVIADWCFRPERGDDPERQEASNEGGLSHAAWIKLGESIHAMMGSTAISMAGMGGMMMSGMMQSTAGPPGSRRPWGSSSRRP